MSDNKWNWSSIYIGTMLLANNIIIILIVYYVNSKSDFIDDIGNSIKQYLNDYTLHISFNNNPTNNPINNSLKNNNAFG